MTFAVAGALAAAMAAGCALLVPFARANAVTFRVRHPDRGALDDAGLRVALWQWELGRVALGAVCAALAAATPVPSPAAIALGALAPSLVVRSRAASARWRAALATTRLLRATEAALRSGASLPEALRRATDATADRLARRPFVEAMRAFDLGAPLDQALRSSALGPVDDRTRIALQTLEIGVASRLPHERAGALVAAIADRLAFEGRLDEEVRARTSGLRFQVVLLALVVPGMAAYLALTVPSLAETLSAPIGRYVLIPAALVLELVGIVASRRLVKGLSG